MENSVGGDGESQIPFLYECFEFSCITNFSQVLDARPNFVIDEQKTRTYSIQRINTNR